MTIEPRETRLKRLTMRSMRRGMKEMDILMMRFADAHLAGLSESELDVYDQILSENDQDLYQWVTGQTPAPDPYGPLVAQIAAAAADDPVSKRPI
ncbi:succinate dehydrogenase assembly factor 2 [Pseudooceanicola sp. MF1-13]|uniref:FAD assembly factor SdhE n=1 Tax=Pseudooceanicola sp. MF1-13 TaxID=3379095 RepID=UPI0038926CEC